MVVLCCCCFYDDYLCFIYFFSFFFLCYVNTDSFCHMTWKKKHEKPLTQTEALEIKKINSKWKKATDTMAQSERQRSIVTFSQVCRVPSRILWLSGTGTQGASIWFGVQGSDSNTYFYLYTLASCIRPFVVFLFSFSQRKASMINRKGTS